MEAQSTGPRARRPPGFVLARGEGSHGDALGRGEADRADGHLSSAPALEVALVYPLKEFLFNVTVRILSLIPKAFPPCGNLAAFFNNSNEGKQHI